MKPLVPDVEALVTAYLTPHAASLGAEVVDQPPDDISGPWVMVTQLADPADPIADHALRALLQFDCYAGPESAAVDPHEQASLLTRTVRAALGVMDEAEHENAIVSGVAIHGSLRLPDTDFDPPRERFVLTATVLCHQGS